MYEYMLELFFCKPTSPKRHSGLQKTPFWDEYKQGKGETVLLHIATWEAIENEVLRRYPDVAYIQILQKTLLAPLHEYIKRYETLKLKIRDSRLHGKGVFTEYLIKKDEVIVELDGDIISTEELGDGSLYPSGEWNAIGDDLYLVRGDRTIYGFINHSRNPNAEISFADYKIRALRDIEIGEEITIDYRRESLSEAYLKGHGATYL